MAANAGNSEKTAIGRPFQPGQSGNPNGRPKTKPFKDALKKAIATAGDDEPYLAAIATALLKKAATGDVQAIKELADRLDGKASQPIVGGDEDDNPVNVLARIERIIVNPDNQDR